MTFLSRSHTRLSRPWTFKWLAACCLGLLSLSAAAHQSGHPPDGVEILRTTDGIPHVRAADWFNLGLGYGYAQAQDSLCTLAEAFVTYAGRRSFYFGADDRPRTQSTFGRSSNLELDFFFQAFAGRSAVDAFAADQPAPLRELIAGYASGYNRYLGAPRDARGQAAQHGCLGAAWLQPIDESDIYRRFIAASLAAGYARFVPEMVAAMLPQEHVQGAGAGEQNGGLAQLQSRMEAPVGEVRGLGSNAIAFGAQAAGRQGSVLLGNPHWYWNGPDRFYQVHLTIPGRLDVAGVSFLGVPVVMIGFNRDVAWSHTVSTARRMGLFELALDPADRHRYMVDGVSEPMSASPLAVVVRRPDGRLKVERRTLFRSRFGPLADFGRHSDAFGWGSQRALAMRDINEDNHRAFRNFFRWSQAESLDAFIAVQREEAGLPWVNTVAIGRNDRRAWYADIGAVPDVPDSLRSRCAAALSSAFAQLDPLTPLLDGSRSDCDWQRDPQAVQSGAMAVERLPSLLREDYVANMNDSYWLSNPAHPQLGFPSNLGGERTPLSMRGRMGHQLAAQLVAESARSAEELAERLMREALASESYAALAFKPELLARTCTSGSPAAAVDEPCRVLNAWSGRAGAGDRGALLWEAWWARLQKIPAAQFYSRPFDVGAAVDTPTGIAVPGAQLAETLAAAATELLAKGIALDATTGSQRFIRDGHGLEVPLYGGCGQAGFFTVTCGKPGEEDANSYLQVVWFTPHGVQARTLLAHGQQETALDGNDSRAAAPVLRYARRDWLVFPFEEGDIRRDAGLLRQVLQSR